MVKVMDTQYYKYPRTPHLPWSPGADEDDIIIDTVDSFVGKEVVVTEKMDGECTTMYKDHIHARSINSGYHPSRTWVQNLHGQIKFQMDDDMRLCGENMFWVHSVVYTGLPSYFLLFNVWEGTRAFSWDETMAVAKRFNLDTVPVLYRGEFDEDAIKALWNDDMYDEHEGYVVRIADSFQLEDFQSSIAKFVRKNHVQTDEHWMRSGGELNMLKVKR